MSLVVRALQNSAQTSVGSHWSNTTGPVAGCTLAANGFSVIIDSNVAIGGANNVSVTAGSFVVGVWYIITSVGNTTWTSIGASSNSVGVVFQATAAGTGNGIALTQATITTAAAGSAVAGGSFSVSAAVSLLFDIRAGTTSCLSISGSNAYTIPGVRVIGGTAANAFGINHTGSGLLILSNGSSLIAGTGATAHAVNVNGTGLIIRVDNGLEIRGSSTGNNAVGLNFAAGNGEIINGTIINAGSAGTGAIHGITLLAGTAVTLNGCIINGSNTNSGAFGINCLGTLTGTNNVFNAGSSSQAVDASVNGFLNLSSCTYNASATAHAIQSLTSIAHILSGTFNDEIATGSGRKAVFVRHIRDGSSGATNSVERRAGSGVAGNAVFLYGATAGALGFPATNTVAAGTLYGPSNEFTGTLQTTVTLTPSASDIRSAVGLSTSNLDTQLSNINDNVNLRLLTSSYTAPLDAQGIRSAIGITTANIDSQLTNINSNVNLRLLASSYTVPPSAETIASSVNSTLDRTGFGLTSEERLAISTAVQAGILNESDGQAILNAIVNAIGNQNIDQVALVAAIRSDLERNGGVLATRLALTEYTAPLDAQGIRSAIGITTANIDSQLSGINNNVSLRMLASSYTAPPTTNSIATQVRTELSPELNKINNDLLETDYYQQYLLQALQATISVS